MKTAIRIIAAGLAVSLALVSCAKQEVMDNGSTNPVGGARTIAVSFANGSAKSTLEGLQPKFVANDVIKISNGSATEDCTVSIDGSGNATITTELTGALTMVYPAAVAKMNGNAIEGIIVPAVQDGTFASANICMATLADRATEAQFVNQTALLRFYVDARIGVKSIKVTSSTNNIATDAKIITVDPDGDDTLDKFTDGPDKRLCYVSVLGGVDASTLTLTSETTTQGTVTRPKPMASTTLTAGTMYNAFIPYYIKIKVSDSPETYQKWAYCNVGAFLPEEYGLYFAWGETTGHKANFETMKFENDYCFDWAHAPFNNGSSEYNAAYFSSVKSTIYANGYLALDYDAARVNWGSSWRMPQNAEFQALKNATYWAFDNTEKRYYVFSPDASHLAGKHALSFPADLSKTDALFSFSTSGGYGSGVDLKRTDRSRYWSSNLMSTHDDYSYGLGIDEWGNPTIGGTYNRYLGLRVRPLSD